MAEGALDVEAEPGQWSLWYDTSDDCGNLAVSRESLSGTFVQNGSMLTLTIPRADGSTTTWQGAVSPTGIAIANLVFRRRPI